MPLESGQSKAAISHNIEEMQKAGHPHKQAVSAALHNAYDAHAAGVLLTHGNRALFVKRSPKARDHQGEWCCPGGSIEEGETAEQAARREFQEETGLTGLMQGDLNRIDEGDGFVTFRANIDACFDPTLNEEHTEARWAPMDGAPQPLHPGVAATLKKLLAKASDAAPFAAEGFAANAEKLDALKQTDRHNATHPVLATTTDLPAGALDKREWDTNGWFEVLDNPLSTVGVYQYSEASINKGGDRNKMVGVYRSPEELSNPETVKSFRLMPWTDDHPEALLGDASQALVPAEQKGVHGVIGEQTYYRDGTLYGNIKVFSEQLARKIAGGKRELSCGYRCDFVPQEGVYEGAPYQYVQKNLRGNHVASVRAGRMGSGVRVLDAAEPDFAYFTFALDLKEPAVAEKRKDEMEDCLDAETQKFIEDSFGSLVGELEHKGYSKEYATKVAGKVAAEKGMTGHHDSTETPIMAKDSDKGEVKDPEGKEDPKKDGDLAGGSKAKDRKSARDARDSARDSMSSEQEEAADTAEGAEDAEEEKEDEKDESKEARDRRSARDRRGGARDQRARDRAKDRAAKDAAKDAKGKGMDATEVAALVRKEVAANTMDPKAIVLSIRKEEAAKASLYGRLSPIVGAFDHAEMTHTEMATYGLTKLGAKVAGEPVAALDAYLSGFTAARGLVGAGQRTALDSAASGESFIDKYLAA